MDKQQAILRHPDGLELLAGQELKTSSRQACLCFAEGDDEGGNSFLVNLHNQQRKLNNLEPSNNADSGKAATSKV